MARVENQPKVILTKEEKEILNKTQKIFAELCDEDKIGDIFSQCDNYESEWYWAISFVGNLIAISEEE